MKSFTKKKSWRAKTIRPLKGAVLNVMEEGEDHQSGEVNEDFEEKLHLPLFRELQNFGCTAEYLGFNLHHLRRHVERTATKISIINSNKDPKIHQIFRYLNIVTRTLLAVTADLKKGSYNTPGTEDEVSIPSEDVSRLKITSV